MEEHAKMQKELKKVDIIILEDQQNEGDKIVTKDSKMKEEHADRDWQAEVGEDVLEHKSKGKDSGKYEDKKCEENVEMAELHNTQENVEMDEPQNSEENSGSGSSDSLLDDSDSKQKSASDDDGEISSEVPMTDAEIEELVAEFLEVENKAAEAQESLEKESLAKLEHEVREELAENLHGDALEIAVSTEMKTYVDEWEAVLDDLETQSAILLEQLDGAGIELPRLYKWIESQVPNGCCTEAWKKRAHWVGSQLSSELNQSIRDAEDYLQSHRPVRRQHGKLLEEGASGYLMRKLSSEGRDNLKENSDETWSSFNEHIQSHKCSESTSFGSKNWASVYLASTPQQAASLGLMLPGIDEVEEIGDVECNSNDPFYADAIANEKDIDLSEEQKKKFKKVREEDDANLTRKLQHQLKRRRQRKKGDQVSIEEDVLDHILLKDHLQPDYEEPKSSEDCVTNDDNADKFSKKLQSDMVDSNETEKESPKVDSSCKRSLDDMEEEADNKRRRTVIIDSDDELPVVENKFGSTVSHVPDNVLHSSSEAKKFVDVIDVDILPSPSSSNRDSRKKNDVKEYPCTACYDVLKACEIRRHPKLQVIVCQSCKLLVEEKTKLKDLISGGFCEWCAKCKDLISCNSCKMLFCTICISRNFGEECLSEAKASGWQCCCCSPVQLHRFIMDCDEALNGLVVSSSGSETDVSDGAIDIPIRNKKRRKKKIRRILDDAELGEDTKEKIAIEKARQDHLKSMQLQSSNKTLSNTLPSIDGNAIEGAKAGILGDATEGYIVNVAREEDEEPVRIPPSISSKLKPHQVAGIQFMWENIVQSVKKVKAGDKGLGCILAHTMGLGKTFQIIAFLYTAMRCVNLGLKTALIVTPVNVLHNWRQEFLKWQPTELKPLRVFMLEDVAREKRAYLLAKWRAKGGVFLIGYAAFRNLSLGRHVKDRHAASEICHCLQDGPDILVCDEAHMIKNTKADITQALKQVKTQRRIALTGSPLQNNLMEYYCMVDFVREGFLGSSLEFRNRFQNPIENGQHTNSTSQDVKIMNQRSHILYEQLKGFVQRMDTSVVKRDLPPKTVFVITVKLSPLQRKLYKRFLDVRGFTSDKENYDKTRRRSFFAGYQALAQIWNHPGVLQMAKEHKDNLRREDALENFLGDDSSSDENVEHSDLLNGEKQRSKPDSLSKKSDSAFNNEEIDWWEDLLREKIYKEVDYSGKMVLLLDILSMSAEAGDKALVFSQSLTTLDMIELFLSKLPRKGTEGKYWKQGKDWYRLDGRTDGSERQKLVERFNEPSNTRVKCTLISTRAGSLGINLHAANRVVLVDGSWNPTYDLQAIFRVWRYGQNKPVYAYRLMAHGTMEEKIYKRQVTKEGLAARVVDRQQIHRTMSKEEILHLFDFGDEENADFLDQSQDSPMMSHPGRSGDGCLPKHNLLPLSYGISCSDKFMESLLSRHHPRWIANYHEHETLLQENEAEKLSKEEQDLAWKLYQQSLEWEVHRMATFDDHGRKPAIHSTPPESSAPQHTKASSRNHSGHQKKCNNLAHMLTLRSKQIKSGESTTCGECSEEISWESLNRDAKSR